MKKTDNVEEVRIDGVKAGSREGIHKRDIHLYNLIKHGGFNMKVIAEKVYADNEAYNKKHVVRLYQKLYNFQDIDDAELSKIRKVIESMIKNLQTLLETSIRVSERKRKIKMILESGDESKLDELLKNVKD